MEIKQLTDRRTALTADLLIHLAGMKAAYTELCSTTGELHQALFRADNRRQNGVRVYNTPVSGMDNVEDRVRTLVEYSLFRPANSENVDLAHIVNTENSRALKFVQDITEVAK